MVQAEIYNTANTDLFHNPQTIKNISVLLGVAFKDSLSFSLSLTFRAGLRQPAIMQSELNLFS